MIAEGNYGQTEGVFLCSLSFARAKKVRRLPGATGTTAIVARTVAPGFSTFTKRGSFASKQPHLYQRKDLKPNPGVAPPAVALLFLLAQNE